MWGKMENNFTLYEVRALKGILEQYIRLNLGFVDKRLIELHGKLCDMEEIKVKDKKRKIE